MTFLAKLAKSLFLSKSVCKTPKTPSNLSQILSKIHQKLVLPQKNLAHRCLSFYGWLFTQVNSSSFRRFLAFCAAKTLLQW